MKLAVSSFIVIFSLLLSGCSTTSNGHGTYTTRVLGMNLRSGYVKPYYRTDDMPNRSGLKLVNQNQGLALKVRFDVYHQPAYWDPILQKVRQPLFIQAYEFQPGRLGESLWIASPRIISKYEFIDVHVAFLDSSGRQVGEQVSRIYPGGIEYWYQELSAYPG